MCISGEMCIKVVRSGEFPHFPQSFPQPRGGEDERRDKGMMLYGRFEHNMDAKGRIFVSVKLREKLGETFIAACVLDKCVSLYSMEEWDSLLQKITEAPMAETRKLLRKVTESAEDVTPDAQGRILLNKNLIAHAGLEKPCLIIGAGRRAEIWNPAVYDEVMADMTDDKLEEEFIKYGF